MGSATARALARRGRRVVGLDRFSPPHLQGSSHGRSRIIREAYFEHPVYVPLVQRAYALWEELERESGRRLYQRTRGLMVGPAEGALVEAALSGAAWAGAELHLGQEATSWRAEGSGVVVETAGGAFAAHQLVLTAGPWLPRLVSGLPLFVARQVLHWFAPRSPARLGPEDCPIALWEFAPGRLF